MESNRFKFVVTIPVSMLLVQERHARTPAKALQLAIRSIPGILERMGCDSDYVRDVVIAAGPQVEAAK
jgi:predicted nucleic acid-binding protein